MSDDSWGVPGDIPPGEGWWRASDGLWYPPETAPGPAQVGEPTAVQPAVAPPGGPGDGGPPTGEGRSAGFWRNPFFIAFVAVVVIGAAVVGIVLATSGDDDDEVTSEGTPTPTATVSPTPTDEPTGEPTPTTEPTETPEPTEEPTESPTGTPTPSATTTPTTEPTAEPATDTCRYLGIDSFGDMQLLLEVTSPADAESLLVAYSVLDDAGRVLTGSDVSVDLVTEGEHLRLPVDTFTEPPEGAGVGDITCEIDGVDIAAPFFDVLETPDDADCAVIGLNDFDEIDVEISFTSPVDDVVDVTAIAGLYLADARFATVPTFVDRLGPDEEVRLTVETFEELEPGVDDSDVDCVFLGLTEDDFDEDWGSPEPTDTCIVTGVDSFGDIQVELVVTNPFDEPFELDVLYAIRGPDGERIYSVYALSDTVAEVGETLVVPHDSLSALPEDMDPLDVGCEILGILAF